MTLAATAVFGYAWLVPAALYAVLWWYGGSASKSCTSGSFLELLCIYGYSLAIYIPVSVLWTIQISALQWCLVLAGAGLSGAVLLLAIWPSIQDHAKNIGLILVIIVLALHILLACGFMLYFFHVPTIHAPTQAIAGNSTSDGKSADLPKSMAHDNQDVKAPTKKIPEPKPIETREAKAKVSKDADDPAAKTKGGTVNDEGKKVQYQNKSRMKILDRTD